MGFVMRWARRNSLWVYPFGISCCADALRTALGPGGKGATAQALLPVDTPEHGDILVVAGRVPTQSVPILRDAYDRMPDPKWVIAFGSCAVSGGFSDTYAVVGGLSRVVPVDVCVPGCPPQPDDLYRSIARLQSEHPSMDQQ